MCNRISISSPYACLLNKLPNNTKLQNMQLHSVSVLVNRVYLRPLCLIYCAFFQKHRIYMITKPKWLKVHAAQYCLSEGCNLRCNSE